MKQTYMYLCAKFYSTPEENMSFRLLVLLINLFNLLESFFGTGRYDRLVFSCFAVLIGCLL